jgi:phosphoesterase RecJ-like protein
MNPHPDFSRVHALIRQAKRILLVSDGRPDGDSIGSTSAFLNWLLREGKEAQAFCREPLPTNLLNLDSAHLFTNDPALFDQAYDLILTFDAGDLSHCGISDLLPKVPAGYTLVMFDHHATNTKFGHINILLTDACSTCEVLFRFFEAERIPLDAKMATSLLTGLNTDTGSFSNGGTTVLGMEAAGKCIAAGARVADILKAHVRNKSVDGLKLWGLALSRLRHNPAYDLVTTYFLLEDLQAPGADEAIEGVSNFLNGVCGNAETIMTLREIPGGKIKGSLRSIRRDISKLAQTLGGGGHKKASGFTVYGKIDETADGPRIIPAP